MAWRKPEVWGTVSVKGGMAENGINKINWGHLLREEFSDTPLIRITPHVILYEITKYFYFKHLKCPL